MGFLETSLVNKAFERVEGGKPEKVGRVNLRGLESAENFNYASGIVSS